MPRLDATAVTVGSSVLTSGNLTGLSNPSASADAASKSYVDAVAIGLSWKSAVAVLASSNIALSGTQTIDSYLVQVGDRVLAIGQTSGVNNGIYVAASGAWSRATDMAVGSSAGSAAALVLNGAVNGGSGYVCTTPSNASVVGTNSLSFVRFSNSTVYSAGSGLTLASNAFSVDSTVLRTTGNQSAAGVQSLTNATESSALGVGALVVSGGASVDKKLRVGGDAVISGALSSVGASVGALTATSASVSSVACSGAVVGASVSDGVATLAGGTLSNLVAPTAATQAATKQYVDSVAIGLKYLTPARLTSTGSNVTASGAQTVDGVAVANGDRVLLRHQTSAVDNGVYVASTSGAWSRATDFAAGSSAQAIALLVTAGSTFANCAFAVQAASSYVIGTDAVTFAQISTAGSSTYTAGTALGLVGSQLNVQYDTATLQVISGNKLALGTASVGTTALVDASVTNAKLANPSLTVAAGTGLSGGGSVSLGGTTTVSADTSVLLSKAATGTQTLAATTLDITASTASTNSTSGALVVAGGAGIGGALNVAGAIQSSTSLLAGGFSATASTGNVSCSNITCTTVSASTSATAPTANTQTIARITPNSAASLFADAGTGTISAGYRTSTALPALRMYNTGTLGVSLQGPLAMLGSGISNYLARASVSAASNQTYTAAQLLGGRIERDCAGADRTDTLPTASSIVALIPDAAAGSAVDFWIANTSTADYNLDLAVNTGVTLQSTVVALARGDTRRFTALVTATTPSATVLVFQTMGNSFPVHFTIENPTSGSQTVAYSSFGTINSQAFRPCRPVLLSSIALYLDGASPIVTSATNYIQFDFGKLVYPSTFTAVASSFATWDATVNNTYPNLLYDLRSSNIVLTGRDLVTVRSRELGAVTPQTFTMSGVMYFTY